MPSQLRGEDDQTRRIAAWGGAVLALAGILGLVFLPSLILVWIVLLVFAVSVVPSVALDWMGKRRRKSG